MTEKVTTIPSLHLFSDNPSQEGPFFDLDYLATKHEEHFAKQSEVSTRQGDNLTKFQEYLDGIPSRSRSRIILFNSPNDSRKSLSCLIDFIAGLAAEERGRVLLLDCNLKTPRLHSYFDKLPSKGLTDYVAGEAGIDEIVGDTNLKEVFLIKSGNVMFNAVKMFMSVKFQQLIDSLRKKYDYILVNSPPYRNHIETFALAKFLRPTILLLSSQQNHVDQDLSDIHDELGVLKLPVFELVQA